MSKALLNKYKDNPNLYFKALEGKLVRNGNLVNDYAIIRVKSLNSIKVGETISFEGSDNSEGYTRDYHLYPTNGYWVIIPEFDKELDNL